jgi:hypothetical protein
MILNLHSDPCPTGIYALTGDDHYKLPLLPWFAAQRQRASTLPGIRNVFEETMADIETMGLLKQAEVVRIESANTK